MPTLEVLDAATHRQLRCRKQIEDGRIFVQIVADEFAAAAAACPILMSKNPETGKFYAGAMLGFRDGEILLADASSSYAPYRPLDVERQGFFISGDAIAIDRDNPRINESEGDPLFDEDGQPGERLRFIQRVLTRLVHGIDKTDAFIAALLALKLVEPIDISLRFDDGETIQLDGLYTVSLDALGDLDDAAALRLFRDGHLQLAYIMAASLRQIPILAARRNQRLAEAA